MRDDAFKTIVGPVDFKKGPLPNTSLTPLVAGQWRKGKKWPIELVIVDNKLGAEHSRRTASQSQCRLIERLSSSAVGARVETTAMLELASLSRAFGGLVVIDHLDFKVEQGEIVGILGPNGAGKTTLFNMIAGVLAAERRPYSVRRARHHQR